MAPRREVFDERGDRLGDGVDVGPSRGFGSRVEVPEGKFASVAKRGGVRLPPRVDERDARDGDSSLIVREETRGRCAGGDGVESGVGGAAKRGRGGLYERSKSPRLAQRRAQTFRRGNRRGTVRGGGRVRGVVFLLVLGGEGFAREGSERAEGHGERAFVSFALFLLGTLAMRHLRRGSDLELLDGGVDDLRGREEQRAATLGVRGEHALERRADLGSNLGVGIGRRAPPPRASNFRCLPKPRPAPLATSPSALAAATRTGAALSR